MGKMEDSKKFSVSSVVCSFLLGVCTVLFIWMLTSCAYNNSEAEISQDQQDSRFVGVETNDLEYDVVFDRVSGVYYAIFSKGNSMSVTPLYNIDGLPMCVDDANHGILEGTLSDVHDNQLKYQEGQNNEAEN